MTERMLITKLVRTDQTRADLYARGHQWPDLKLFDLSDLLTVGIEPADLEVGTETPCRFWANYELSDKLNKNGNPYKDVIALESIDTPATTTSTDTSALLAELRTIRELLERWLQGDREAMPDQVDQEQASKGPQILYAEGQPVGDNEAERQTYAAYVQANGFPPKNIAELRTWFAEQNGN